MIDNLEPHYSVRDAATYLAVSDEWLREQLRRRAVAGFKIAGRWRMTESQIEAAISLMSTEVRPPDPVSPAGLPRRSQFKRRAQRRAS